MHLSFWKMQIWTSLSRCFTSIVFEFGQICLCGSRVLIHSSIYDEFMSRYLDELKRFEIGPVISEEHRSKVLSYIELAKEEGGEISLGETFQKNQVHGLNQQ